MIVIYRQYRVRRASYNFDGICVKSEQLWAVTKKLYFLERDTQKEASPTKQIQEIYFLIKFASAHDLIV